MAKKRHNPPTRKPPVFLSAAPGDFTCRRGELSGFWEVGGGSVELSAGQAVPSKTYVKEAIRCGQFVKLSDGVVFEVTAGDLANWVYEFRRMRDNGVKVPMPALHRSPKWEAAAREGFEKGNALGDPRHNMGWVDDMYMSGGSLWVRCTLIGDEAIRAAAASDVSIFSPASFTDGRGNEYRRPITHLCLCTDPVVPGLGSFVPVALALGANQEDAGMDVKAILEMFAQALGVDISGAESDDAAANQLAAAMKALAEKKADTADDPPAAPPTGAGGAAPGGRVASETTTTKRDFMAGGQGKQLVKLTRRNRELAIQGLRDGGFLRDDAEKRLKERYLDDKAIALSLSRADDDSDPDAEFDAMVESFRANGPIQATGEKTGRQDISASRDTRKGGKDDDDVLVKDAERRSKAGARR